MKPVSPAGILVVKAPWTPWTPRVHLRTSNVVASGWQEGKRTNTLGGLMVDELVARLLWGCWRHLARDPPRGHSSAEQEQKSLCHPKWPREGFWGPPWKHMLQVGVWVFIFPRTLFPSRYPALLCAPSDTAEFSSRV